MNINSYLESVNKHFKSGYASEHTYRGDFAELIKGIVPNIHITNEPSKVTDCGNPDYVITRKKIPVGFIEAKDLGKDLNSKSYKEQFGRYRKALDNLIITNYIHFQFFQKGELVHEIDIAKFDGKNINPIPANHDKFTNLINEFCVFISQTIKSPKVLAEMMAGKARLLENILENAVYSDEENDSDTELKQQFDTFRKMLIHDLDTKGFADIYAQTLAYGMFAARLHDPTLDTFSRIEAAELIPKTNPLLRNLFQFIGGFNIDERIRTTVDNLADLFRATDVKSLLKTFGKETQQHDPIIHFYETFLAEYDPKLRKSRGVWYTPGPVVNYIVRAVDDILKAEFGLADGLADTCKTTVEIDSQTPDRRSKTGYKRMKKEVHKVQILDPAVGTGTFLAEVIKHIYQSRFEGMEGAWSGYVDKELIPRLNGFEILMASYAMAHLKLDLLLTEMGYKPNREQRFRVFLTNSLEEHHPDTGTLFSTWLSNEATEANYIKRDTPVMVVLGNPPYSGISSNIGEWIVKLIEDYKYVDGEHFGEKKHWLQDDYVKFIRYGQHFISKNGEGILAYINNHSFLDNPTFRGMRWNLAKNFDKIFIIDLHGNSKKHEISPDGSPDQNVFDIQQGVSINLFVKTGKKRANQLADVFHFDLWGSRESKYEFLWENSLESTSFKKLDYEKPYFFFIKKDLEATEQYEKGFSVEELFNKQSMGITSARDGFVIDIDKDNLLQRIISFSDMSLDDNAVREKYFGHKKAGKYPKGDTRGWSLAEARKNISTFDHKSKIVNISYRPFDKRFIYYTPEMVDWGREDVMANIMKPNIAFCTVRVGRDEDFHNYFITDEITDKSIASSLDNANVFPLYVYPETGIHQEQGSEVERRPNLHMAIVDRIAEGLGLSFTPEKEDREGTFAPIDILDYIYAVLHSPSYREKYKELLKIEFPRVPYPGNEDIYWSLVRQGSELRLIHLLDSPKVEQYITSYPNDGNNTITRKVVRKDWELYDSENSLGRIWINDEQYFDKIPQVAWEFYIGGYQPAQKWLKDRVGRTLSYEEIIHYQKIIVSLSETDRLMKEIDKIEF